MKLLDPLSGYRIASGLPVLHAAFLIIMLIIPDMTDKCEKETYQTAFTLIWYSHLINAIAGTTSFFLYIKKEYSIAFVLDCLCILAY
jgi:hypothetical protein